jgi:hypothetical protein
MRSQLGQGRNDVIALLMRGVTREEAVATRRAILRSRAVIVVIVWIALAVSIALPVRAGRGGTNNFFWDHPLLSILALVLPVLVLMEYVRVRPHPPVSREVAEMLAPAGNPCGKCGEQALLGAAVCPQCGSLLRVWKVVLIAIAVLVLMLLLVLWRHGAFL